MSAAAAHQAPQPLDEAVVRHVATLSRLAPTDAEVAAARVELAAVLSHVAKVQAIDVTGVEPMPQPFPASNRLADDTPGPMLSPEQALANAPKRMIDFLAVPKVLGEGSA